MELVHLRASQVNGCSACVASGALSAKKAGETDERLFAVGAWREAPYFTDAEWAALALAEAPTRLSDRADPVPDAIWDQAAAFRRTATRSPGPLDRHDQPLQPPQRHHPPGRRRSVVTGAKGTRLSHPGRTNRTTAEAENQPGLRQSAPGDRFRVTAEFLGRLSSRDTCSHNHLLSTDQMRPRSKT
jgi:AhpD family alkylhydroperoxidase